MRFESGTVTVHAKKIKGYADYDLVRKMRGSICIAGPLLARLHKARISLPGDVYKRQEDILLNHDGVAFFSVHQFPAYPGTGERNVGKNCFNYPVAPAAPRETYRATLARALGDLKNVSPELIAVSAGFDAYARDPLADGTLFAEDFHWLGQALSALKIPFFSLLEGGYSKDLPELIFAYLKGVKGK